jgi:hypothetical protein
VDRTASNVPMGLAKTSFFSCGRENKNTIGSVVVSGMSVGVMLDFGMSVDVCTVVG